MIHVFAALLLLAFCLVAPPATYAQGADGQFLTIYNLIQEADSSGSVGQVAVAIQKYSEAETALKQLQTTFPTWNQNVVQFRLKYVQDKLSALRPYAPKALTVTNAPPAKIKSPELEEKENQLKDLNDQIRYLQSEKAILIAKLKEALSAQPAASDPRELAKAEEAIRNLQKENDLLKTSLQQEQAKQSKTGASADRNQKMIAELQLKLQQQIDAAAALSLEKEALQNRIRTAGQAQSSAEVALRAENESLKQQLAAAQAKPVPTSPVTLADDRAEKALAEANLKLKEQTEQLEALRAEKRIFQEQLAKRAEPSVLATLQDENSTLKQQLADARKKIGTPDNSEDLRRQLQTAQSRLDALQATNEIMRLQNLALESRVKTLSATPAPTLVASVSASARPSQLQAPVASANAEKLRQLEQERDQLRKQLDAALKQQRVVKTSPRSTKQTQAAAAQVSALNARLATLEAQKVPYTPEELALFEKPAFKLAQASSLPAKKEENKPIIPKKSSKELPAGAGPLVAEAQRAFAARRFDEAEKKYLEVLELDKKNVYALANLAAIQMEENKLAEAEDSLKKALKEDPQDGYALSLLGILRFRQERFDDALDLLSQSAQADPLNSETHNYLGITLSQKGQRGPAEAALRKAVQLAPGNASAHYNLAVVYATQQPPFVELARYHYQKALDAGHGKNPDLEKLFTPSKVSSTAK
jgi:Tfp pilus assembly protein PilF